ncbi:hypothetical protein [Streptomyces prunicolor]|uniref:hypothetical protein n=1 Tax=Streptomyces prunicolor TaxID=67348 RepID=UPI0003794328|nr:hypothetical protein [Streptomyces prunicolor]
MEHPDPQPAHAERPEDAAQDERLDWFLQRPEPSMPGHDDADPVRTVWQLPRFRLGNRRFTGRVDHALVLVTRKGSYRAFLPPERPTSVRGCVALYEVNTDTHTFRLNVPLPSRDDASEFEATADITWRVIRPDLFVASQERDVPGLVSRRLLPVFRAASRSHPIEDSPAAEEAVRSAVEAASPVGATAGLEVTCFVRLRRDATERSHQARLRTARHDWEAAEPEHRAATLRARFETARLAEKIEFYDAQLARSRTAALALHLAAHPEDTQVVMEHLRTEEAELVKNQLHLIDQALDGKRLEDYQLAEPHQLIAERMAAILHAKETPPAAEPPPSYGELPRKDSPESGT